MAELPLGERVQAGKVQPARLKGVLDAQESLERVRKKAGHGETTQPVCLSGKRRHRLS